MPRSRKHAFGAAAAAVAMTAIAPLVAQNQRQAIEPPSKAMQDLRRIFFADARINMLTFRNMDDIFYTVPVPRGRSSAPIARADAPLNFSYMFKGKTLPAEDFLERSFTNALLIIKDDRIVYERYRNLADPKTKFLSMSMAKSVTSILIGAALQDGLIRSLDDQIIAYVPELKNSAFDGVTIRQALEMRSGIDRSDDYDPSPNSDMTKLREETMVLNERRMTDEALIVRRREPPGQSFQYSTLNTTVLGWVIEKATRRSLQDYMSRRLWGPLGSEADAYFITDGPPGVGRASNGMGFNAVLRDYGRIGQMMLHDGKANGGQVVPASWVRQSTAPVGPEPVDAKNSFGYAYQWWTLANSNAYMAIGLQGQFIFVDPDTGTVIVKLSYFPLSETQATKESEAFFRAASAWRPQAR